MSEKKYDVYDSTNNKIGEVWGESEREREISAKVSAERAQKAYERISNRLKYESEIREEAWIKASGSNSLSWQQEQVLKRVAAQRKRENSLEKLCKAILICRIGWIVTALLTVALAIIIDVVNGGDFSGTIGTILLFMINLCAFLVGWLMLITFVLKIVRSNREDTLYDDYDRY